MKMKLLLGILNFLKLRNNGQPELAWIITILVSLFVNDFYLKINFLDLFQPQNSEIINSSVELRSSCNSELRNSVRVDAIYNNVLNFNFIKNKFLI